MNGWFKVNENPKGHGLFRRCRVEDDLELDREMEYLIEPEEALGGGSTIE